MSSNEQGLILLAGFASSSVKMDGDSLKHLPTIPEKSISETLSEIPWETPKQKRTDGKANCSKKAKIAQKEPRKTIAKQLAEQKPRTKILDSEIRIKNIIQGSPIYVPYYHVKPNVTNKGKGVKNIKLKQENKQGIDFCSTNMARIKRMKNKDEKAKEKGKEHKQKEHNNRAKERARRSAAATKKVERSPKARKTDPTGGKSPHKQLATKAAHKAAPKKPTKPCTHYAIIAKWDFCHFQKSGSFDPTLTFSAID